MRTLFKRAALTGALGLTALALVMPSAESAPTQSATLYVSPTATNGGADTGCTDASHSTVQSALDAAQLGGTVVVCAGTYKESVNINKMLTLAGQPGAVIDASGAMYGIGIGADHVTVTGMTVKNADAKDSPADGILTAVLGGTPATPTATIGNFATITNNVLTGNMGSGIDVNSTSNSLIANNHADSNGIGINMVNDFGSPASNNTITGNTANDNAGGCGIVMADHSGTGIFNNAVTGNTANRNGLGSPTAPNASSGSGIIIAGGPKGGVHNNLVSGNTFIGNGHGGVTLHSHAPGANFNGNAIVGNLIGTNNTHTDYKDLKTTGIYLGAAAPLSITVTNNLVRDDAIGIFTAGPVTVRGVGAFVHVTTTVVHISSYAG